MVVEKREEIISQYRNHWLKIPFEKEANRILFSIFHGIAERTIEHSWNEDKAKYFLDRLDYFRNEYESIPENINNRSNVLFLNEHIELAYDLGLPINTPRGMCDLNHIMGEFCVIQDLEENIARVSMYNERRVKTDPTESLWVAGKVRVDEIPKDYRVPGAWIVNVMYISGGKCDGRSIEPACNIENVINDEFSELNMMTQPELRKYLDSLPHEPDDELFG